MTSRDARYRATRLQVLARSDVCYWCKRPVSDVLPVGHPLKATADHVLPLALGGSNDATNLVASCWACNSRRGMRPPNWNAPPTVRSRDW